MAHRWNPPWWLCATALSAGSCAKGPVAGPVPVAQASFEPAPIGETPVLLLDDADRPIVVWLSPTGLAVSRRSTERGWTSVAHPLEAPPYQRNAWIREAALRDGGVLVDVQLDGGEARRWWLGPEGETEPRQAAGTHWLPGQTLLWDRGGRRSLWVDETAWVYDRTANRPLRHGRTPYVEVPARLGGTHIEADLCPIIPPPHGMDVTSRPFAAAAEDAGLWVVLGVRQRECASAPPPCVASSDGRTDAVLARCAAQEWWLTPLPVIDAPMGVRSATLALDSAGRPHAVISGDGAAYYAWLPILPTVEPR